MAALRPTELQIILSATRDIEKVQNINQQNPRTQQELMALQLQRVVEQRKRQAQAAEKSEQNKIKVIEDENKEQNKAQQRQRKSSSQQDKEESNEPGPSDTKHIIDFLI